VFLSTSITGLSLLDGIQVIRPDMIHIVSYRSVISIEHMASADFAVFFWGGWFCSLEKGRSLYCLPENITVSCSQILNAQNYIINFSIGGFTVT